MIQGSRGSKLKMAGSRPRDISFDMATGESLFDEKIPSFSAILDYNLNLFQIFFREIHHKMEEN